MSQYVSEEQARVYVDSGELIGRSEGTAESKYTWWEVYLLDGKYCAASVDEENGVICGEEITEDEIGSYIDWEETIGDVKLYRDGNQWCAVYAPTFIDIQVSPCGFGETKTLALVALAKDQVKHFQADLTIELEGQDE